jgi:hypothetical protein
MHPVLQDVLKGVARSGAKALVSAVDSFLEDVDVVLEGASGRVKRARSRVREEPKPKRKR